MFDEGRGLINYNRREEKNWQLIGFIIFLLGFKCLFYMTWIKYDLQLCSTNDKIQCLFLIYYLSIHVKYISLLFTRKTFLHEYMTIYHDSFPPTLEKKWQISTWNIFHFGIKYPSVKICPWMWFCNQYMKVNNNQEWDDCVNICFIPVVIDVFELCHFSNTFSCWLL